MKTKTYLVSAYYKNDRASKVQFTVSALSKRMVREFCAGFVPELMVMTVAEAAQKSEQHYDFTHVNPCIAARFHLGLRRRKLARQMAAA